MSEFTIQVFPTQKKKTGSESLDGNYSGAKPSIPLPIVLTLRDLSARSLQNMYWVRKFQQTMGVLQIDSNRLNRDWSVRHFPILQSPGWAQEEGLSLVGSPPHRGFPLTPEPEPMHPTVGDAP